VPSYSLGIDIGGTFTDIVVHDHDTGRQVSRKILTTHDDPARAVAAGVAALLGEARLEPRHFTRVVHATTLFTNALIERTGAVTGLITTAGFADTLEIGRERKFELYDLDIEKPEPLVPRNLRLEVTERTRADGSVKQPLDGAELQAQARRLVDAGVRSIAVVFLHSYANPRHEVQAARIIGERHPDVAVTASHEVAAEIREYERASTAVANAFIKPLARRYLELMARRVGELGVRAPLLLMLSSGGLTHVAEAERAPVGMLESGPAAGAIAAAFFGREDSGGNLLAFDMGGTTAKLSLVDGGDPLTAHHFEANNEGMYRPVTVRAPEDCLLNPRFPAAVVSRAVTGHYVPVLVLGALHQVIPDKVMAGAGSPLWALTQSGLGEDGKPYTTVLFFNGGMGATPRKDGENVLSWPSNISSTPVEVAERQSPLYFHYKRLRPGSAGAGRFRGGLGQDILIESESERPLIASFMAERTRFPAPGLAGGADGGTGDVRINGRRIDHRRQHVLARGDQVLVRTPGGGGYGPASARDPKLVRRDRELGYVPRRAPSRRPRPG